MSLVMKFRRNYTERSGVRKASLNKFIHTYLVVNLWLNEVVIVEMKFRQYVVGNEISKKLHGTEWRTQSFVE